MIDIRSELANHLHGHASPILFVGSGLSRRYAGVENWEGLLRRFASMTARPYDYYRSKASGDFPAIATAIAEPFADLWWDSPQFATSREMYAASMANRESALKIEVALHLSVLASRLPVEGPLAAELDLLREA